MRRARADWPRPARRASLSAGLSLYALYWVLFIVQPQIYRVSFLLIALVLTFLLFPATARGRGGRRRAARSTGCSIAASLVALRLAARRLRRSSSTAPPTRLPIDLALGAVAILLVLEATRRTVGWILPATAVGVPRSTRWLGPCVRPHRAWRCIAHRGYGSTGWSARST